MAIGTSLGAYFPDELSFHMNSLKTEDNNVIVPPSDSTSDKNEVSPQEGLDRQQYSDPNKPITVSDSGIDDRRNQGLFDILSSHLGEQLTMEKIQAIMQHPLANVSQTLTANEPPTPLWNSDLAHQLGSDDIK